MAQSIVGNMIFRGLNDNSTEGFQGTVVQEDPLIQQAIAEADRLAASIISQQSQCASKRVCLSDPDP